MSSQYTESKWKGEQLAQTQKTLSIVQQRQELAQEVGTILETKLKNIQVVQKTINQKVIHEVIKEPVYTECRTTPNGVRLIEDAINNRGQPTRQ